MAEGAPRDAAGGFLGRWSRRKAETKSPAAPADAAPAPAPMAVPTSVPAPAIVPAPAVPSIAARAAVANPASGDAAHGSESPERPHAELAVPPPPTMADVALLTPESDYARFVAPGTDTGVQRAALKKLFADPHYNVMDGLDIYIDDYGKPDPIPLAMLRQMSQAKFLGLFDDEDDETANAVRSDAARGDAGNAPQGDGGTAGAGSARSQPPERVATTGSAVDAAGAAGSGGSVDLEHTGDPADTADTHGVHRPHDTTDDHDPDLRLQPDDADRWSGTRPRTRS
jgi:Protein of unknown function (DUF3306)